MSLHLELDHPVMCSLRDAIAYEFYMDNMHVFLNEQKTKEDSQQFSVALAKFASTSYAVADIFLAAGQQKPKQNNDNNTSNDTNS